MSNRRTQIEDMLKADPDDAFLRYSLALELEKEGELEPALELLAQLMRDDPPYVPAFHMSGQWLVQSGKVDEARRILREGIETARAQGKQHDAAEMSDLLTTIGTA